MKKYVQEATDINVWTSLKENTFDRGKDIRKFIEGLELLEGNAFISLDAKLSWYNLGLLSVSSFSTLVKIRCLILAHFHVAK